MTITFTHPGRPGTFARATLSEADIPEVGDVVRVVHGFDTSSEVGNGHWTWIVTESPWAAKQHPAHRATERHVRVEAQTDFGVSCIDVKVRVV